MVTNSKKSLENKNNSNEIILIGLFLKIKGDFSFLDVQKGGCKYPRIPPPPRDASVNPFSPNHAVIDIQLLLT